MSQSLVEKILGAPSGASVTVTPDYMVVNDGPSAVAIEGIATVAAPERVRVYYDHDVPAGVSETSVVFDAIWRFAQQSGARFVQAEGMGYQHLMDTEVKAGEIVVSGGEHTGIFGGKGALSISLSIPALRDTLVTGECSVMVPETVCVAVCGKLPAGADMVDAALTWLAGADVQGRAVEWIAPEMSDHERSVLCAIACARGAFTALCVAEGAPDAVLDLSGIEPMLMLPCLTREQQMKAWVQPRAALLGTVLQAGQIGGDIGGTIEALRLAAQCIQGKKLAHGFRLSVCPATSADYLQAIEEGIIEALILYGAQIHAVGDRSIVRQGPGTVDEKESLLTTGLYTFDGCMGVSGSKVYCGSVRSVIEASATAKM